MKTIIQLLIAALVLHGCLRMGGAVWRNLQFKDAVEQETRFATGAPIEALHQRILELAQEHDITIAPEDVVVERRGQDTHVTAAYSESIPLAFGFYTHQQLFEVEFRARALVLDKVR